MTKFKVGQKVVCVEAHLDKRNGTAFLKVGKVYTIKNWYKCSGGTFSYDVGIHTYGNFSCACGKCDRHLPKGITRHLEKKFAPLEEAEAFAESVEQQLDEILKEKVLR